MECSRLISINLCRSLEHFFVLFLFHREIVVRLQQSVCLLTYPRCIEILFSRFYVSSYQIPNVQSNNHLHTKLMGT